MADLKPASGHVFIIRKVKTKIEKPIVYEIFSLIKILILNILFTILSNFRAKCKFIFESPKVYSRKN